MATTAATQPQLWRCDVCKSRTFKLLEEAEAHEALCDGTGTEKVATHVASIPQSSDQKQIQNGQKEIKSDSPQITPPQAEKRPKPSKEIKKIHGFFYKNPTPKLKSSKENKDIDGTPPAPKALASMFQPKSKSKEAKVVENPKPKPSKVVAQPQSTESVLVSCSTSKRRDFSRNHKENKDSDDPVPQSKSKPDPTPKPAKEPKKPAKFFLSKKEREELEKMEAESRQKQRLELAKAESKKNDALFKHNNPNGNTAPSATSLSFFSKKSPPTPNPNGKNSKKVIAEIQTIAAPRFPVPSHLRRNVIALPNHPWTLRYAPTKLPDTICGKANKKVASQTLEFLETYKIHLAEIAELAKKSKKKKKKNNNQNADWLAWGDSEDEDDSVKNCLILCGAPGTGKTSLARAAIRQAGGNVLEVNTSEARGGTALKKKIEEATLSKSFEQDVLTVILIDEIDIVFERDGDGGFWPMVKFLIKRAKCPIILTSNVLPREMGSMLFKCKQLFTYRPTKKESADYLAPIFACEPGYDEVSTQAVEKCCEDHGNDLRRILLEYQTLNKLIAASKSNANNNNNNNNNSIVTTPTTNTPPPSQPLRPPTSPIVQKITPATFAHTGGTTVTIEGAHFAPLKNKKCTTKVDFQTSCGTLIPCTILENGNKIQFQSPKAPQFEGVNEFGLYEPSFEDSLCSKFGEFTVVHEYEGVVVHSNVVKFEWTWPYMKDGFELRERARREKKGLKNKTLGEFFSNVDDDAFEVDSDLDEGETPPKRRKVFQEEDDIEPRAVTLDPATLDPKIGMLGSLPSPSASASSRPKSSPPSSPRRVVSNSNFSKQNLPPSVDAATAQRQLAEIIALSDLMEVTSAVGYLEDASLNATPVLAGKIDGFAEDMENSTDAMCSGKNLNGKLKNSTKAPSFEMIFKKNWGDGYYGSSDCFATQPSTNDRRLMGGGGRWRTDRYIGVVEEVVEEEDGELNTTTASSTISSNPFNSNSEDAGLDAMEFVVDSHSHICWSIAQSMRQIKIIDKQASYYREAFLRAQELVGLTFELLPPTSYNCTHLIFAFGISSTYRAWHLHDDVGHEEDAMLDNRSLGRRAGGLDLRCFSHVIDERMACDYIPALRSISVNEIHNDKAEEQTGISAKSARRSTRAAKGRLHHFDSFGVNIASQYVGRKTGKKLAKLFIGGVANV
ncbi:hypothetical protein TrLO_g10475 [Triparma laevis f. longispina]|uniref:AAA+ ATPase domain-containing protein n=1 Tax=Triparma laevis f. longispina TaxID=1714387 RepID=A0A9W7FFI8_9STRA|nr:hypothetical protein TrLO_g10475 [Triparma laevis f. longispina]